MRWRRRRSWGISSMDSTNPTSPRLLERCPQCDYDLTGSPAQGKCPECGFAYDETCMAADGMRTPGGRTLVVRIEGILWGGGFVFVITGLGAIGFLLVGMALVMLAARGASSLVKGRLPIKTKLFVCAEGISVPTGSEAIQIVPWAAIARYRFSRYRGLYSGLWVTKATYWRIRFTYTKRHLLHSAVGTSSLMTLVFGSDGVGVDLIIPATTTEAKEIDARIKALRHEGINNAKHDARDGDA
jgi:hypothetical protein